MGLLEHIESLELSDEKKAELRAEALRDMAPRLRSDAEAYVEKLRQLGFSEENECSGFLKQVRRILMSADAYEPGAVLMSDSDLGLTGDQATGATAREDVSLADTLKALFDSLPAADSEGKKKLVIALSDQGNAAEAGDKPDDGDESGDKRTNEARSNLSKITGHSSQGVSRKRYRKGGMVVQTGGDA